MKRLNNLGFSTIEILLLLILLSIIGGVGYYVYSTQRNTRAHDTSQTATSASVSASTKTQTTTQPVDPYADWVTYTNSELGYSFKHPKDWKVTPVDYANKLNLVQLDSSDIKTEELPIGGDEVVAGSRAELMVMRNDDNESLETFKNSVPTSSAGVSNVSVVDLGSFKGVQYHIAYEGSNNLRTHIIIATPKTVDTSFDTKDEETTQPNFVTYKKVLASIKLL